MYIIDSFVAGFGPSASLPQFFTENQFQVKDDLSVTKGKHGLKFGVDYRRTRNGSSFQAIKNGEFLSWGGEDLITDSQFSDQAENQYIGYPYFGSWYYAGAAVNQHTKALPDFYRGYRANEVGAYAQDDWRIIPRLTLNLGVRWDYFGPPTNFEHTQTAGDSNFYFGSPITPFTNPGNNPFMPVNSSLYAAENSGSFRVVNNNIWNKDLNNFAPRFGFAYDVFDNQKWVVRGGFGIYYDRMYNNIFENIRFNPPFYCACTIGFLQNGEAAGNIATPGLMTVPFTATGAFGSLNTKARPRHMDQNLVSAYYEQVSYGVEYQVSKDMALEANYVGTFGRKLLGIMNLNTFDGRTSCSGAQAPGSPCALAGFPGGYSTRRPNTTIGSDNFRTPRFGSNYNGLNVTLRKRFSSGLQFNANYTWAKSLDELSDAFRAKGSTGPTDPMNLHLDYGPSDFDVRHRFVTSYNYDLPFMKASRWLGGWALNGIFTWQTGTSIALFDSNDSPNGTGLVNQRPDFVGTGSVTSSINTNVNPAHGFIKPADFAPVTCPMSVNGGIWCNSTLGRGSLHGPHFVDLDFGVNKSFKITERFKLRFDANFFNLFNHPNFSNPDGNVIDASAFGQSQSTFKDGGHRVTQLALRLDF